MFICYPVRLTIHYFFHYIPPASVFLKPVLSPTYYNFLCLLFSSVSLPHFFGPTTLIHPRSAPLLPVCPYLSFPHSRHFASVSISRLHVCLYTSINPFNPCCLQLLVIPSPFTPFSVSLLFQTLPQKIKGLSTFSVR